MDLLSGSFCYKINIFLPTWRLVLTELPTIELRLRPGGKLSLEARRPDESCRCPKLEVTRGADVDEDALLLTEVDSMLAPPLGNDDKVPPVFGTDPSSPEFCI